MPLAFVLAAHLRGVVTRLDRRHERRLKVVTRLQAGILEFLLLACFPIIILEHDDAVLVPQLQGRIR